MMYLALFMFGLTACTPALDEGANEVGTVSSIYRVNRSDFHEYVVSCSDGYDWLLSDRNSNPGGLGTGELRIREVYDGPDTVVGYGGLGYLMYANNWIGGGHGYATEPLGLTVTPWLEPDETSLDPRFDAQFVTVGFDAGYPVVALAYSVSFDCDTYAEIVNARALVDFSIGFEYAVSTPGPGECLLPGGYDSVNGTCGFGCAATTVYSHLPASQTIELEGSGHRFTATTNVPLADIDEVLVRDQSTYTIKAYAVRGPRSVIRGDTWSVTNTYRMERMP